MPKKLNHKYLNLFTLNDFLQKLVSTRLIKTSYFNKLLLNNSMITLNHLKPKRYTRTPIIVNMLQEILVFSISSH